jgi:hypothetical protein
VVGLNRVIKPARSRTLPFSAKEFLTETLNNLGLSKWKKILHTKSPRFSVSSVRMHDEVSGRRAVRLSNRRPINDLRSPFEMVVFFWGDGRICNEIEKTELFL